MPAIRTMIPEDRDALHALWERSVRATHAFLSEDDILFYSPMVYAMFELPMEFRVVHESGEPLGFMALDAESSPVKLEALFVDPAYARQGLGTLLVRYAENAHGPLTLDVNEQNPAALAFYKRLGFRETGRSARDGAGKPFPLIHMRLG